MTVTFKTAAASLIALGMMGGTGAAFADPPHCPPGHAKKGWCDNDRYDRRDRVDDRRDDWRDARERREAYRDGYEEGRRDALRYGDRYYTNYSVIRDYNRYGLSTPPNGYYYAKVDNDLVLVAAATQLITQFLAPN